MKITQSAVAKTGLSTLLLLTMSSSIGHASQTHDIQHLIDTAKAKTQSIEQQESQTPGDIKASLSPDSKVTTPAAPTKETPNLSTEMPLSEQASDLESAQPADNTSLSQTVDHLLESDAPLYADDIDQKAEQVSADSKKIQDIAKKQSENPEAFQHINTAWLNTADREAADKLLQQYNNKAISEQSYLTQITDLMHKQLSSLNNWTEQMGGKVDLNQSPYTDFDISWLSEERQRLINDLAHEKDFGGLSQYDFNNRVSAIMNDQLAELKDNLSKLREKINADKMKAHDAAEKVNDSLTAINNRPKNDFQLLDENSSSDSLFHLPNTGEISSYSPVFMGALALILGSALIFFSRRRPQK
ncbi:LPXTG cell wall anchor domain-containing protein [Macrococcus bovicus]|uniref:LPXTG cell wall anchor domain-containing protein n=1 Tax=Macrococcus bovicus TaxID=69968 RepID=A0A4R6BWV8_9STAP|nr:LPXTG cell wall anchor domain-containing protein [Macrococcus bovicus]TDM12979.1 LPXTG cell wall anchor domain-containing protein [Macrococcus bovicus]